MNVLEIFSTSSEIMKLVYFVILKSIARNIFMRIPGVSPEMRFRIMILMEHLLFTIWGYYVVVILPTTLQVEDEHGVSVSMVSWFYHTIDNWKVPQYPFPMFRLFYHVKIGSHLEDLLYLFLTFIFPSLAFQISNGPVEQVVTTKDGRQITKRDSKMDVHHISTAALCIGSYLTGYVKIGSLVMLLHDASDLPLDLLRLSTITNWKIGKYIFFPITLLSWIYWRLWFLPMTVMYSIAFESASLIFTDIPCTPGNCYWMDYPAEACRERLPFLLLLGCLLYLHFIWFVLLAQKGFRELFPNNHSNSNNSKVDDKKKSK